MIEMVTGRRLSGNATSPRSSMSSLTSLDNNSNSNSNNNIQYMGVSRMKRFQMVLWVSMVLTFFHLRRKLPNVFSPEGLQVEKGNSTGTKFIHSTPTTTKYSTTTSPPILSPNVKPILKPTSTSKIDVEKRTAAIDKSPSSSLTTDTTIIIEEKKDESPNGLDDNDEDNIATTIMPPVSQNQTNEFISENVSSASSITSPPSSPTEIPQNKNTSEPSIDMNKLKEKEKNDNEAPKNTTISATTIEATTRFTNSSSLLLPWSSIIKPRSDDDLTVIERNFAEMHCDLTHLKNDEWYPSSPEDDWQQRAPYLIVAGVWNAGVNPLANALLKHPQIDAAKTNGFFLPKQFQRYYDVSNADNNNNNSTEMSFNIKVFAARERMYAQVYSKSTLREKVSDEEVTAATTTTKSRAVTDVNGGGGEDSNVNDKNNHVAMDVSPGLIFYAHKTAHSILCTVPWVKVVIVLRNPIDRLYQQWSYSTINLGLKLSLEDWMAQEMKLLQSTGLIGATNNRNNNKNKDGDNNNNNNISETVISEEEAWNKYQSVRNIAGAIGRSLYLFQLEEWINAYIAAGKNPSDEIIILTTENIEDQPQEEYNKLIQFLQLSPISSTAISDNNSNNNSDDDNNNKNIAIMLEKSFNRTNNNYINNKDVSPMKEDTRNMLRQFFRPYNQRLTKLLRSNGFEGNWDERWK